MKERKEECQEVKQLRKLKAENNWTYQNLAQELGVHYQTVVGWFAGVEPSNLSKRIIRQYLLTKL